MDQNDALPYVAYVLDRALSADRNVSQLHPGAKLVGWQCGFEPLFVAVLDCYGADEVDEDEAVEIATDYLSEINWFAGEPTEPDYVIDYEAPADDESRAFGPHSKRRID